MPIEKEKAAGVLFSALQFFRLDPSFHSLMNNEKLVAKQDFLGVFDRFQERNRVAAYTLTGLSADCDILLWSVSPRLEDFIEMSNRLQESGFGKHLVLVRSHLGTLSAPGSGSRMLFVQPFPEEALAALTAPAPDAGGKLQVLDGRGLGEQPLVALFESDDPLAFRRVLARSPETAGAPVHVCVLRDIRDLVDGIA
ncbi:MAG: hypothetical protein A2X36_12300 [Elusimicrobia bacterium GWA2_69_24]|nr:MAG: hypothetical protein A2X36_12300 [Elusimicrobia bacterium GWA2_69_24]